MRASAVRATRAAKSPSSVCQRAATPPRACANWPSSQAEASVWLDGQLAQARGGVAARWQTLDGDFEARLARTAETRGQAASHLAAAWRELENRRLSEAGYEGLGAIDASRRLWTLWWHGDGHDNGE